jgi:putative restriction endonuclease
MPNRFFGTPDGVKIGDLFISRRELHERHVHAPTQAGISGTRAEGADSVVVSGGYSDDHDHGDYIIYTGHGGNDANTGRQISDQSPDSSGNAGLITSMVQGLPVRVVRGSHRGSSYAPPVGYQYAGLFLVTDAWMAPGQDGFQVMQFKLERIPEQTELVTKARPDPDPAYSIATVSRRIRDTALSREIKSMYANRCQICGTAIPGVGERLYSEGAHVKPLGRPHLGADALSNLLCLCPNHHTELDIGGMVILDDYSVALTTDFKSFADIRFRGTHLLGPENAKYQREMWAAI